jgi:hypothetical protein
MLTLPSGAGDAMEHSVANRVQVYRLAEQLVAEYAGALPPGQVLVIVHRTYHLLTDLPPDQRLEICEEFARRLLQGRCAAARAADPELVG